MGKLIHTIRLGERHFTQYIGLASGSNVPREFFMACRNHRRTYGKETYGKDWTTSEKFFGDIFNEERAYGMYAILYAYAISIVKTLLYKRDHYAREKKILEEKRRRLEKDINERLDNIIYIAKQAGHNNRRDVLGQIEEVRILLQRHWEESAERSKEIERELEQQTINTYYAIGSLIEGGYQISGMVGIVNKLMKTGSVTERCAQIRSRVENYFSQSANRSRILLMSHPRC